MAVATHIAGALEEARRRTLALVAPFSDAEVETAHSALMSPLVWDLAHIAACSPISPTCASARWRSSSPGCGSRGTRDLT